MKMQNLMLDFYFANIRLLLFGFNIRKFIFLIFWLEKKKWRGIGKKINGAITPRTKHIAVKYHWFRESIGEEHGVRLEKIASEYQKADIFTKGLTVDVFRKLRKLLMGW